MISSSENLCQALNGTALDHIRPVVSRQEALAAGLKMYFTGKPCPKGHFSERWVSGGNLGKCRDCFRAKVKRYHQRYRSIEKNKEKHKNYSRAHYLRNKAKKDARSRLWRKNNPEKMKAFVAKWQNNNREKFRSICREWARNNRDKRHAHRAMRRGAPGTFSAADIAEIMTKQKRCCATPTCRTKLGMDFHVDHIMPLKLGGSNWRRNIQLLCATCNRRKGARDPLDYARSLGLLL